MAQINNEDDYAYEKQVLRISLLVTGDIINNC